MPKTISWPKCVTKKIYLDTKDAVDNDEIVLLSMILTNCT